MKKNVLIQVPVLITFLILGCQPAQNNAKPVIEDINYNNQPGAQKLKEGETLFESKCTTCHFLSDKKMVGPGLRNVTNTRPAGWLLRMITNPDEMLDKDPQAMELLRTYNLRMPSQGLSRDEALSIISFLRNNDTGR